MGKRFKVEVHDGSHYEIEAQGFNDAACGLLCDPTRYPLPKDAVIGMESPTGSSRFYVRRGQGRGNLFQISASAAAMEMGMRERKADA